MGLSQATESIRFQHLTVEKGLSNGRVTSVVQDSIGFVWIGTKNGLNRYDGVHFKTYNQQNTALGASDIVALKVDSKNRMWVGTVGGGLSRYNKFEDEFYNFKESFKSFNNENPTNIYEIFEDSAHQIWLGTEKGLCLYNEKSNSFTVFSNNKSELYLRANKVKSIAQINHDTYLIGTLGGGVYTFNTSLSSFTPLTVKNRDIQVPEYVNSIVRYSETQFLVGTNGNGVLIFDVVRNTLKNFLEGTSFENIIIVRTIEKESNQNFWIGTDGHGLLYVKSNAGKITQLQQYVNDNRLKTTLSNNTINCIFQDNQQNIWLGTAWKGVDIVEKASDNIKFYYSDPKGHYASPILSILRHKDELWMGTDGTGLTIYNVENNQSEFYSYNFGSFLGTEYIQCIKPCENGNFWLGTFSNGLILIDKKKNKINQYKRLANTKHSLPYNDVRAIVELPSGNLWVGTWGGGLSYFDIQKQQFKNYRHNNKAKNSISSDDVLSILKNDDGTLWVATFGSGLNYFDPETELFRQFDISEKVESHNDSNYIFSCVKDSQNNLWLGTKDGLVKFNTRTHKIDRIGIGGVVNSNTVVGLIIDDLGFVWMSTKAGIFRLNPKGYNLSKLPEMTQEFHINAVHKDQKGILYFGGTDKVISFDPAKVKFQRNDSKVIITNFKLFNREVSIGKNELLQKQICYQKEIALQHNQNVLTFDFAAMDYPFSNKEQFAVKMEGFEDEWRNIESQNTTTFTNLSPGEYTLKIKTLPDDFATVPTTLKIKISPPVWKTWWAYLIYALVFLLSLLLYHKYAVRWAAIKAKLKLEQLRREEEDRMHGLKQKFFTDISHEIRTPLTLINNPLENLLKKGDFNAKQQKQLSMIRYNSNRLLKLVNELLSFRRLETGNVTLKVTHSNIVPLINEIQLSYLQQAGSKNINYKVTFSDEEILVWFDKMQLEKAIHNLISNAFKFTNANDTIRIGVKKLEDSISIRVSDTGRGIEAEKIPYIFDRFYKKNEEVDTAQGFGIGLSIAKDIVALHSGTIHVKSIYGKWSKFTITLPLGNTHFSKEQLFFEEQDQEQVSSYIKPVDDVATAEVNDKEFSGMTILLVEDNKHLKEYLNEILSDNYIVFVAENGKEGFEKATDIQPDLIISDIVMPIMDGVTLCHQIKSDVRTSHIPVILLTARALTSQKIEGYETGADAYLTKPFDETVLKTRIKNLLNNRKLLRDRFLKEGILNPKEITLNSPDENFLRALIQHIEDNIDNNDYTVEKLSSDIAMSHSKVYKKVKALTGMTIVQFMKDFKLKRAAQLLKQQHLPIIDVAFMVGYTDRRHFSDEFKKKYKKSPTAYKRDSTS